VTTPRINICIVGAGPRGLSVLERICANAGDVDADVTIHVVDPYPPGAGAVWRTRQNRHLLMNTVASQITIFPDTSVEMAGPITTGPSLHEWATELIGAPTTGGYDPWVLDEARRLGPDSYPTRAFYGHYLEWVHHRIVTSAPAHVRIETHPTRAIALDDGASGDLQRMVLEHGSTIEDLHAVVLAQGHVGAETSPAERALADFAAQHRLRYVAPGNPADADLSRIRPGDTVAIRGLGLCFFDYMALLTEGRGGSYVRDGDRLVYRPSGREPRILATSRRGVPYHARGDNQKGPHGRHTPRVVTPEVIEALRMRGVRQTGLQFRADIWPLIAKEVETVYYATLVGPEFGTAYLATAYGSDEETALLDAAGVPADQRWDWHRLQRPYADRIFASHAEFRTWLLDYLRADLVEAHRGNLTSPIKAALDVLRDLRNEVRLLVDHGGLEGQSHSEDLDGWYTPLNAYLSIGPPASRIEEALALIDAGVLDILGPGVRIGASEADGCFLVETPYADEPPIAARALIDARLHQPDIRTTVDPLLRYLLVRGRAIPFRIAERDGGLHETGGLAVIDRPYHVVDATGKVHPRRFAFGVPTEAVHWVTAAGIRPGVNSVTLADADAIARTIMWLPEYEQPRPADDLASELNGVTR
jgi:FAD-NAD(P)-binding